LAKGLFIPMMLSNPSREKHAAATTSRMILTSLLIDLIQAAAARVSWRSLGQMEWNEIRIQAEKEVAFLCRSPALGEQVTKGILRLEAKTV
jgi:hypothetical protein